MIGLVVGFPPSVLVLRGLSVSSDWLVSAAIILTANLLDGQIDPTVLSKLWMFLWGAFGSFALDVVAYGESFTSTDRAKARLHRRAGYAGARLLLAIVAGGLAVGLDADKPVLAIYIGAAAPIILRRLAAAGSTNGTDLHATITKTAMLPEGTMSDSDHAPEPAGPTAATKVA
jgi:hypothetical protein